MNFMWLNLNIYKMHKFPEKHNFLELIQEKIESLNIEVHSIHIQLPDTHTQAGSENHGVLHDCLEIVPSLL